MLEFKKNRNHILEAQQRQNRSYLNLEHWQVVIRDTIFKTSLMLDKEWKVQPLNALEKS